MSEKISVPTKFGEIGLRYAMIDTDGTNLEEGYDVYDEDNDHVGQIFTTFDEDLLTQDVNNLDEDYTIEEYKGEISRLETYIEMFF